MSHWMVRSGRCNVLQSNISQLAVEIMFITYMNPTAQKFFGKFGQKSFEPTKFCQLIHLSAQCYEKESLEYSLSFLHLPVHHFPEIICFVKLYYVEAVSQDWYEVELGITSTRIRNLFAITPHIYCGTLQSSEEHCHQRALPSPWWQASSV